MTDRPALILALDPSSTRTGYALLSAADVVVDAGYLRPAARTDAALDRIAEMCADLRQLIEENVPDEVVIEVSSGKVQTRHKGGGAGLAVYGMAVGAIWQAAATAAGMIGSRVFPVVENLWTGGRTKADRQNLLIAQFPQWQGLMARDYGADVADAIELGQWWWGQRVIAAIATARMEGMAR